MWSLRGWPVFTEVGAFLLLLVGCPWNNGGGGGDDCAPDAVRICVDNTVYSADSCGNRGAPIEVCGASEVCVEGACAPAHDLEAICNALASCNDCVTTYPCGWCDGRCTAGNDGGASSAACASWSWTPAECDGASSGDTAFPDATPLALTRGEERVVSIDLAPGDHRAVFGLGALAAGDEVRLRTVGGTGSPIAVLFEVDGTLADRAFSGGVLQTRRRLASAFLAFMPFGSSSAGQSDIAIRWTSSGLAPSPNPQVVSVEWGGGTNIAIHGRAPISFPAFDASILDSRVAGNTDWIMSRAIEFVRAVYAGAAVEIYSSHEGAPPNVDRSALYVGGSDPGLLGLADTVDRGNGDTTQNAIVYIENFSIYHVMNLDREGWARFIANVIAHEVGHLLGLWHVADPDNVMDTTGSARDIVGAQGFIRSDLEERVFSIGAQDDVLSLVENVGGNWSALKAASDAILGAGAKREATMSARDRPRVSLPGLRCGSNEI